MSFVLDEKKTLAAVGSLMEYCRDFHQAVKATRIAYGSLPTGFLDLIGVIDGGDPYAEEELEIQLVWQTSSQVTYWRNNVPQKLHRFDVNFATRWPPPVTFWRRGTDWRFDKTHTQTQFSETGLAASSRLNQFAKTSRVKATLKNHRVYQLEKPEKKGK